VAQINLSNPVLTRELRASLRNARAFALLALYVALLGAFVTANFPGDVSIDFKSDGGARGFGLFMALFWGQVGLILIIIPALATGALAQERERQTLQPLLLTPLSPLQIVWGKAGGVLSLVGLLLVATLPLTSLCFLLGGVEPGLLIGSYAVIFGLAAFTTGFGLYCSARWHGATRSMLMCYLLLPVAVVLVAGLAPFGVIICGFFVIVGLFYAITQGWKRGARTKMARTLGELYAPMVYLVAPLLLIALLVAMVYDRNIGYIVVGVAFVMSYLLLVAHWGLLQTARELMNRADAEPNLRQRVEDLRTEWSGVVAPEGEKRSGGAEEKPSFAAGVPTSAATSTASATQPLSPSPTPALSPSGSPSGSVGQWQPILPGQLQAGEATPLAPRATPQGSRRKETQTYGVTPFLSDKMNPIYARELRSGLLGKWKYLLSFGYAITILSEVLLLAYLLLGFVDPNYLTTDLEGAFRAWGRVHLGLLLIFAAWFGARAIAPEREGQTLEQLFTIPLPPSQIIGGKMMAVLTFALYVWVLALPMSLMMGLLGLVRPSTALWFPLAEVVLGAFAASWGVLCSFNSPNVRRALALSLGGASVMILASALVYPIFELLTTLHVVRDNSLAKGIVSVLPIPLAVPGGNDWASQLYGTATSTLVTPTSGFVVPPYALASLVVYALLAFAFFVLTARNFQKLARSEPTRG
jgi:ABC-type transport system involved in multi-copper enzyme maturation permease subunit/uncharacterized membrane protein